MCPWLTFHGAGVPFNDCHLLRFTPLKSTIASEGGTPAFSCVLLLPAETTRGSGRDSSFGFQRCRSDWVWSANVRASVIIGSLYYRLLWAKVQPSRFAGRPPIR